MDWDNQYAMWVKAHEEKRRADAHEILVEAQHSIPKDKSQDRWKWFEESLLDQDTAVFVLAVFARHPIPKALFAPMLAAGVRFGNASTIRRYVEPCIESFGVDAVEKWFVNEVPDDLDNVHTKHEMARYWYNASGMKRRH